MSIYIPPNCNSLDKIVGRQQIRLGIQGFPGSGKTWAAMTFRNPIVLNLDRGLGAHQGRPDIIEIPFYKPELSGKRGELKDKLVLWLEKEGPKISEEQTLVIDGLSATEVAYHQWFSANESSLAITKEGTYNKFIEWQIKEKYYPELGYLFKSFKCDVILLAHEAERPDKSTTPGQPGSYTGKIRPILTGKAGDQLIRDYTDWFRQSCSDKPTDFSGIKPESLANWGMTLDEFKKMCATFTGTTIYFWQTQGDDKFDAKASSLVKSPKFIPANWESFSKYMRKQTTT